MSEDSKGGSSGSLEHLRSPGRGMNFGRASIARVASVLVPLLAEISRGDTSLRAEIIFELEREDPEWARLMTALLMLHGDIDYRVRAAEVKGAERHKVVRYVAMGLVLDDALREGSGTDFANLDALRGAVASLPAADSTSERVRESVRALEAHREGAGPATQRTASAERRESSLVLALTKLDLTAAEVLSYFGRTYDTEVPEVPLTAEVHWNEVSSNIRLGWIRALGRCLEHCAANDLRMSTVEWSPSSANSSRLRVFVQGSGVALEEMNQQLSGWLSQTHPAVSPANAGLLWQLFREGNSLIFETDRSAISSSRELSAEHPARTMRIIIVDDDPIICSVVRRVLSRRLSGPCEFQVFTSPDAALAALTTLPAVDLVISDLSMPSLSGADLYARSVQERGYLSNRFVFISGMELPGLALDAYRSGLVGFVRKPFRPEELLDAVNRALEQGAVTPRESG